MDELDPGWGESVWGSPAGNGWQDEINDAIEEASMPPLDPPISDPISPEHSDGSSEGFPSPPFEFPGMLGDCIREGMDHDAIPIGGASVWDKAPAIDENDPLGHCLDGPELPPGSDVILLDILPTAITSVDEGGRVQIEPDRASMAERDDADREAAEHLIAWLNATGDAPGAIAHSIRSGSARLEMLMRQYDDLLIEAGYDRSDPDVQQCDAEIHALHDSIEHAKEVFADLRR